MGQCETQAITEVAMYADEIALQQKESTKRIAQDDMSWTEMDGLVVHAMKINDAREDKGLALLGYAMSPFRLNPSGLHILTPNPKVETLTFPREDLSTEPSRQPAREQRGTVSSGHQHKLSHRVESGESMDLKLQYYHSQAPTTLTTPTDYYMCPQQNTDVRQSCMQNDKVP